MKEAFVKAVGTGLSTPLRDVAFTRCRKGAEGSGALLWLADSVDVSAASWHVAPLLPTPFHVCAHAAPDAPRDVVVHVVRDVVHLAASVSA